MEIEKAVRLCRCGVISAATFTTAWKKLRKKSNNNNRPNTGTGGSGDENEME